MADDTVRTARHELLARILELPAALTTERLTNDTEIAQAIDALIAAVRAEYLTGKPDAAYFAKAFLHLWRECGIQDADDYLTEMYQQATQATESS